MTYSVLLPQNLSFRMIKAKGLFLRSKPESDTFAPQDTAMVCSNLNGNVLGLQDEPYLETTHEFLYQHFSSTCTFHDHCFLCMLHEISKASLP